MWAHQQHWGGSLVDWRWGQGLKIRPRYRLSLRGCKCSEEGCGPQTVVSTVFPDNYQRGSIHVCWKDEVASLLNQSFVEEEKARVEQDFCDILIQDGQPVFDRPQHLSVSHGSMLLDISKAFIFNLLFSTIFSRRDNAFSQSKLGEM